MSRWPVMSLGDRAVLHDKYRVPVRASERKPGPYPYYGASGIVDHVAGYIFDGMYALVAEDGENLRSRKTPVSFLASGRFWVNNHAHVFQGNADNDTRFLCYALEFTDLSGYITGSAQPKLSQASLLRVPIPAPDLQEQKKIADVLTLIADKAESSSRIIDLLMQLLDAKASELAFDLPTVPLSDLAQNSRSSLDPRTHGSTPVDHYSLPAFDAGLVPEKVEAQAIKSQKFTLSKPSVMVSKLNPRIDRTWFAIPAEEMLSLASTEFVVFQSEKPETIAAIWLAVRSTAFLGELVSRVTGTSGSHQRVRPEELMAFEVPDFRRIPDSEKSTVFALLRLLDHEQRERADLLAFRGVVAPQLLRGAVAPTLESCLIEERA